MNLTAKFPKAQEKSSEVINRETSPILQAVAHALADGCCGLPEPNGECCMTDRARSVFAALEAAGGPSLAQCEAWARGDYLIVAQDGKLIKLELRQTPCYGIGVASEAPS